MVISARLGLLLVRQQGPPGLFSMNLQKASIYAGIIPLGEKSN